MTGGGTPGLVSIVVASYNHARFLDRRMQSLLAQTYAPIEIIVIDDRSPDDSVAVLRKYASHNNVTLLVREQNGGWVTVSNQGVSLARGEFVLFANCDDACEPTMIARLIEGMRAAPGAGISFCRSRAGTCSSVAFTVVGFVACPEQAVGDVLAHAEAEAELQRLPGVVLGLVHGICHVESSGEVGGGV